MILFLIFLAGNVLAVCDDGQIDVNSASLSELDEIYGIGPAKAQAIIDSRPYETLDDLVNAYGIGEATLENIKSQGLACIESDEETEEEKVEEVADKVKTEENSEDKEKIKIEGIEKNIEPEVIVLTGKTIKSEENFESDKSEYAIYGLGVFGILICVLLFVKNFKTQKNEFRE